MASLIFVAFIGILHYFPEALYTARISVLAVLMTTYTGIALISLRGNMIISFRLLLLLAPTLITAWTWSLLKGNLLVAPFGESYQTWESTWILCAGGGLAGTGAVIGWLLAARKYGYSQDRIIVTVLTSAMKHTLQRIGVAGCIIVSCLFVYASGGIIGAGAFYADGDSNLAPVANILGVLHAFSAAIVLISLEGSKRLLTLPIGVVFSSFAFCILTGSRADYLFPAMLIVLLVWVLKILSREREVTSSRLMILVLALAIPGFVFSTVIGKSRFSYNLSFSDNVIELVDTPLRGFFVTDRYGHDMLMLDTANHMLGGFYGMIAKINLEKIDDLLLGRSYIDYLYRLPPSALGLERPLGLEWSTDVDGSVMSQGGIFEPAEAYANFGLPGCFVVSMILSYFLNWILLHGIHRQKTLHLAWYLACGFMLPRWVWYQNFAFVRIATVYLTIWASVMVLARIGGTQGFRKIHRTAPKPKMNEAML